MAKPQVKKPGKDIVKWDEEFKKFAKEGGKGLKISSGGKYISFAGGRMSFEGNPIKNDELRCIILAWRHLNIFYDPSVPYSKNNPQSPLCYAFGTEPTEMEPYVSAPDKQHDTCTGCPHAEYNTADNGRGRGKACSNKIKLLVVTEDDLDENADIIQVTIPTMSRANFSAYYDECDAIDRPTWAVVALMKRVPDGDSQFKVTFEIAERIDDVSYFQPLKELSLKAQRMIEEPFPVVTEKQEKPKAKGKPAKFARR